MPHRYVVIVPRSAPETLAYLSRSFKDVPEVEVIVDRRTPSATAPPLVERRERVRWSREAFGCTLVRIDEPAPARDGAIYFRAVPELRGA